MPIKEKAKEKAKKEYLDAVKNMPISNEISDDFIFVNFKQNLTI